MLKKRMPFAIRIALRHFLFCLLVAALVALLVFSLWYPVPYYKVAGGLELFALVVCVDLICGPLLTFIFANPLKPRAELRRDIALVAVIQMAALIYGVFSLYQARPVYMAYEGDRFRLVSAADIDPNSLLEASAEYRSLPVSGPELISVKLLDNSDPGYLASVQDAMQGFHPSYKPERWEPYAARLDEVKRQAKPLRTLLEKNPKNQDLLALSVTAQSLSYLPLDVYMGGDWVVILDSNETEVLDILPVDGWK